MCTVACDDDSDCQAKGLSATCRNSAGRDCSAARKVKVCVAECKQNSDCTDEIPNLSCLEGQCIPTDETEFDMGLEETNRDASTSNTSDKCRALDALSSGDDCVSFTGWTWNGTACEPVICGCEGIECDRIFTTARECQEAYATCIDGIYSYCGASYECLLTTKGCCPPCGRWELDDFIAIREDSEQRHRDSVCDSGQGCDPCTGEINPYVVAHCRINEGASDGLCAMIDLEDYSLRDCSVDSDCTLMPPSCCACWAPAITWLAISDSDEYYRLMCTPPVGSEDEPSLHPPVDDCSATCTPLDTQVTASCEAGLCVNPLSS